MGTGHRAVVLFLILAIAIGRCSASPSFQLEDRFFSAVDDGDVIGPGNRATDQDEVLNRIEKSSSSSTISRRSRRMRAKATAA
jgi:hypothetical protein